MYKSVKRVIDFILAIVAIILLSPLFLIFTIAIKVDSPGPVFFKQKRVGMGKAYFNILKFRTMHMDTPGEIPTHLLQDPQKYITRVGRLLRRTSLDELPQLLNIVRGEMSFVGPRPVLWNEFDLIEERDKNGVNSIRPGLTGLAQIAGRDELSNPTKAMVDELYAKNVSARLDFECILKTIGKVLRHDGIVEGKGFYLIRKLFMLNFANSLCWKDSISDKKNL